MTETHPQTTLFKAVASEMIKAGLMACRAHCQSPRGPTMGELQAVKAAAAYAFLTFVQSQAVVQSGKALTMEELARFARELPWEPMAEMVVSNSAQAIAEATAWPIL